MQLTDAELIAKLLGWVPYNPSANYSHCRCYRKGRQWEGIRIADGSQYCKNDNWPDLANWNDIRRMEEAIVEQKLFAEYLFALTSQPYTKEQEEERRSLSSVEESWWFFCRATQAQRVAAAVKVIQEAGL